MDTRVRYHRCVMLNAFLAALWLSVATCLTWVNDVVSLAQRALAGAEQSWTQEPKPCLKAVASLRPRRDAFQWISHCIVCFHVNAAEKRLHLSFFWNVLLICLDSPQDWMLAALYFFIVCGGPRKTECVLLVCQSLFKQNPFQYGPLLQTHVLQPDVVALTLQVCRKAHVSKWCYCAAIKTWWLK